ncbi:MAG: enoyl-CoA hydratase [Acidimicrobiaceae bacterium]|nr:enoyl-CoA hydratase [Acidimicrobiaceae bacterium]MEC9113252.1 crotonase/enoyl-CoA hydratase family protein [Actinomycetota bacterium]
MTYTCFNVETRDGIAHIRMIRPERANSMIPEFWDELPQIVNQLSEGGDARAIVLSAEGRHFCSGMDLSVFAGNNDVAVQDNTKHISRQRASFRTTALQLQRTFSCLEESRLPVLSAIQGACIGGGIDMVSATDLRYATKDAFFSIHEINIGMTADVGTLQRMPKLVPEGVVRELAYTGRNMSASEAKERGFVNEIYEDQDAMDDAVLEIAKEIASKSPMAIWGTKQTLNYGRDHSVADGLEYIATWNAAMFDPDDMAEAFMAQTENREADFPDHRPTRKGI